MNCWCRPPGSCRGRCRSRIRWCARRCYDALGPARRTALHARAATLVDVESVALRHRVAATPARDAALSADLADFAEREALRQAWPSAAAHLVEAARLAPDPGEEQRMLLRAVSWLLQTGDAATAETFADSVRALPAGPSRDSVLGSLAMARGEPATAEHFLTSAWAQLRRGHRSGGRRRHRPAERDPPVRAAGCGGVRRVVPSGTRADGARNGHPADGPDVSRALARVQRPHGRGVRGDGRRRRRQR